MIGLLVIFFIIVIIVSLIQGAGDSKKRDEVGLPAENNGFVQGSKDAHGANGLRTWPDEAQLSVLSTTRMPDGCAAAEYWKQGYLRGFKQVRGEYEIIVKSEANAAGDFDGKAFATRSSQPPTGIELEELIAARLSPEHVMPAIWRDSYVTSFKKAFLYARGPAFKV